MKKNFPVIVKQNNTFQLQRFHNVMLAFLWSQKAETQFLLRNFYCNIKPLFATGM